MDPVRVEWLVQARRYAVLQAGDREQWIEEERLVLAAEIADRPPVQPLARDVEHFEGDVAQSPAAVRCIEPEPRHVAAHRLAFLLGPVGDEVARRAERGSIIEQPNP